MISPLFTVRLRTEYHASDEAAFKKLMGGVSANRFLTVENGDVNDMELWRQVNESFAGIRDFSVDGNMFSRWSKHVISLRACMKSWERQSPDWQSSLMRIVVGGLLDIKCHSGE